MDRQQPTFRTLRRREPPSLADSGDTDALAGSGDAAAASTEASPRGAPRRQPLKLGFTNHISDLERTPARRAATRAARMDPPPDFDFPDVEPVLL
jgi:hypothetical protein